MRHKSYLRSPLSLRSVSLGVEDAKQGPANHQTAPIVALQTSWLVLYLEGAHV